MQLLRENKTVSVIALSLFCGFLTAFFDFDNTGERAATHHLCANAHVSQSSWNGLHENISHIRLTDDNLEQVLDDLPAMVDGYQMQTIVLDPGHGGKDPGCSGVNSKEKTIALGIALELGEFISESYPRLKVVYTRDKDVFIPLHKRAAIANKNQADLFISIHCNYVGREAVNGTETYVLGLHRAEDNLAVAKRENAAIFFESDYEVHYGGYDPNSAEGHILMSLFQNAFLDQSIFLAGKIEEQFGVANQRQSRGVKQAGFLVLRETAMPSVLIETGFLSNKEEEQFLLEPENQKAMAQSIFRAIEQYKEMIETPDDQTVIAESDVSEEISIHYLVQVAASTKPLANQEQLLRKLEGLKTKKEEDYYKYLVGPFETLEQAKQNQQDLRRKGFERAFIVAYEGQNRISLEAALAGGR